MATPAKRSAADFFDNPALSDVTIIQVSGEGVREYHAHKAVLCMESGFFHAAFTGDHSDEVDIKVSGDNEQHFEFILKYIYTNHYDVNAITNLAETDEMQRVLFPMGICIVAEKYMVPTIYELAINDVRAVLTQAEDDAFKLLQAAVCKHYGTDPEVDSAMGKLISSVTLGPSRKFTFGDDFDKLVKSHPVLGADLALELKRKQKLAMLDCKCGQCGRTNPIPHNFRAFKTRFGCLWCKRDNYVAE